MKRYWLVRSIKMVALFIAFIALAGVGVMLLWNALIPEIFGVAQISWVQALGLLILARLLVGSRGYRGWGPYRSDHWRKRWESKMANMSPEQRAKFKEEFSRYGCFGSHESDDMHTSDSPTESKAEA